MEATLGLHAERGIAAVGVHEIAHKAGVGIGTVYHHFPTYDDVIRGCAGRVKEITRPPDPAVFDGVDPNSERLRALVRELFSYYDRYRWFGRTRADRDRLPLIETIVSQREQHIEALVREALKPMGMGDEDVYVVTALVDFGVYEALMRRGLSVAEASGRVADLLVAALVT